VAYTGFQQEKTALENEMIKLGIGSYVELEGGAKEFKVGEVKSIEIKALVMPDIEVSGGSINVSTGDFTGSGKLNASGVPKIDIKNDSSAYLITQKLTIADKGGNINYNGQAVSSNPAINDINVSKTGANFSDLKIANATEIPTISVTNNYAGSGSIPMKPNPKAEGYDSLPKDDKTATLQYTPINYIEVTKDIHNPVGNVILNNKQGSIRINSGANVNGLSIEMTAKDSISQGYTDGIVNIAYTPEDAYKDDAAKLRSDVGWDNSMPTSDKTETKTYNTMYKGGTGRIAGDAIYIAARDININGLIQAGYNGYKASVTQKDVDNASEAVFFNGVTMYKVNEGGVKSDKNGYRYYEPQIYYDKDNKKLYVEDINSAGGKVYLAGRIMSTGNGKIVVADGTGDIDIRNSSTVDMKIGNVISSGGNGIIQIVDTAQDKLTEYSSGQTRTIDNYSAWLANNSKGKVTTSDGLTVGKLSTYNPKEGLTYRWAQGLDQTTVYHYYKEEVMSRWGNGADPDYTGRYEDMSNTYNETSKDDPKKNPLGEGYQIYNQAQDEVLKLYAQNKVGLTRYGIDRPAYRTKSGFFGYYHHWHHF